MLARIMFIYAQESRPKWAYLSSWGIYKGKSALMIFDKHPEYKQKQSGRHFCARGYYVDTVGRNEEQILAYMRKQTETDMQEDGIK